MAEITLPNNWKPRDYQLPSWSYLENGGKRLVEVWHRRCGKDEVALHWTAVDAIQNPGNYWHMMPEYAHGRRAIWDAVNPHSGKKRIDEAFPPEIRRKTNQSEMKIELVSGAVWHIVGSDNFDGLVGSPPRGVVFSEWSLADPRAWAFIEPILEENGGWAIFPYTPRGNNHGKTMYDHAKAHPDWFAELLTADTTGVFTQDQLSNIKAGLISIYGDNEGEAVYNQEYHCSFEGCVPGAYYAKQMSHARQSGRIGNVPHQSGFEVDTYWDLGIDDSMTIWFIQHVGKSHAVIDYYENTGFGLEHYAKHLKSLGYNYGNHYMPHDAEQREMTNSEIALSRKEVAENLGIKPIQVVSRVRNIDVLIHVHIPAVRQIIGSCWFDEKKCAKGISALEGYCAEYDEVKKKLGNRPLHNWCFTSETYLLTKYGKCQIINLPKTGEVMTLCGWKPYQNPRVTRTDAPLVEVVFNDGNTVRCTPDHLFLTVNGWKSAESLMTGTVIQSALTQLPNILMVACTDYHRMTSILKEAANIYIGRLGKRLSEKYLKPAISTTKIMMSRTTICQISNAQTNSHTYQTMPYGTLENSTKRQEIKPLNGMGQKRDVCGTADSHKDVKTGQNGQEKKNNVLFAIKHLWVWFAKAVLSRFTAHLIANPLAVTSVTYLAKNDDVWCITVPDGEHFALANGAIAHNCSHGADGFRTFAVGYRDITGWDDDHQEERQPKSKRGGY